MTHWPNDYFRLASDGTSSAVSGTAAGQPGFFKFGPQTICFGRCETGAVAKTAGADLYDVSKDVTFDGCKVWLPIDPSEVIENLHRERYQHELRPAWSVPLGMG